MPGTAVVTINGEEWSINVATTSTELIQGLSGVASIPVRTGMLFILPARQVVTVQTEQMLFAMDIIFIKDNIVLDVARNIQPGFLVEEATPIDMFLEVNAGEAVDVSVGDVVVITDYTTITPAFDLGSIVTSIMPLIVLGFVAPILGGMLGGGSSHSSNEVRRLGKPRTEEERAVVHKEFYGTEELPPRGTGLSERGESEESRRLGEPKTEEERGETHYGKYGSKELPERGRGRERITTICPICKEEIVIPKYDSVTRSEALRKHLEEKHGHQSSNPSEFYWEIFDIETGEIMQRYKPYSSISKVYRSARDYQRIRSGKDKEHLVVIRIYDTPEMEEWGKTIKYVMESGMHHGIPILIGKTPLQEAALDRLWPYGIIEVHSDGDLTVISSGKKYVVTTEGGVFAEEEANTFQTAKNRIDMLYETQFGSFLLYRDYIDEAIEAKGAGKVPIAETLRPFTTDELRSLKEYADELYYKKEHSIHGEPRRRLVEQYGSWAVGRAEAICPEDDVACVVREAKRLIGTIRGRYGEEAVEYVTITNAGKTVFHLGDTVSIVALERENKRVRELGEKEATY